MKYQLPRMEITQFTTYRYSQRANHILVIFDHLVPNVHVHISRIPPNHLVANRRGKGRDLYLAFLHTVDPNQPQPHHTKLNHDLFLIDDTLEEASHIYRGVALFGQELVHRIMTSASPWLSMTEFQYGQLLIAATREANKISPEATITNPFTT
jgi:hypothetical protein